MKKKLSILKQLKENNSGLSLVELLVTVMVMTLVTGMIVVFISTSRTSYEVVDTAAELQTESEVTSSFIRNIAVDAYNAGVTSFTDDESNVCDVLWFVGPDGTIAGDELQYFYIVNDVANKAYRYVKLSSSVVSAEGGAEQVSNALKGAIGDRYSLLAEHAETLSMTMTTGNKGTLISVNLGMYYNNTQYPVSVTVLARNMK